MPIVTMRVTAELDDQLPPETWQLLDVEPFDKWPDPIAMEFVYSLHAPHAPAEATAMCPVFHQRWDGKVQLVHPGWLRADGTYI